MLNGSSLSMARWFDELDEPFDLVDQKFLRSVGEGCKNNVNGEAMIVSNGTAYRKINAAVVDFCVTCQPYAQSCCPRAQYEPLSLYSEGSLMSMERGTAALRFSKSAVRKVSSVRRKGFLMMGMVRL